MCKASLLVAVSASDNSKEPVIAHTVSKADTKLSTIHDAKHTAYNNCQCKDNVAIMYGACEISIKAHIEKFAAHALAWQLPEGSSKALNAYQQGLMAHVSQACLALGGWLRPSAAQHKCQPKS